MINADFYKYAEIALKILKSVLEIKKAFDEKREAEYQTEILRTEARQAKAQATEERQSGIEEARRIRLKSILNMSETKTDIASGNINLFSSTALNLLSDDKLNGELDALVTLKNSESKAKSYIRQSQKYYKDAALKVHQTKNKFFNDVAGEAINISSELVKAADKKKQQ